MKPTLFIADLHLAPDKQHLNQLFNNFIQYYATTAAAVYILGDLFEVWIGDDAATAWSNGIAAQLAELHARAVRVYLMPGNRDFLVGQHFAALAQCEILADPTLIELYGSKILLKHGDDLCTLDRQHQWFRKIVRAPCGKQLYLSLPLYWRSCIATKLRKISANSNKFKAAPLLDTTPAALTRQFATHKMDILIHGHTHNPSIHHLWFNEKYCTHIVLSDWNQQGNMLCLNADGDLKLNSFEKF